MISNVIVAGAGIAGLTLATALRRRGVTVRCLERAAEAQPAGAGIALPSNGVRALARLGLEAAIVQAGRHLHRAAILDWRGRELGAEMKLSHLAEKIGAPVVALHRTRLHAVLRDAAGADVVRLATSVVGYREQGDRVLVSCDNGDTLEADLLVGADGLRSAVRAQLVRDGEPRYSGYTSWRGITPAGSLPAPARMSETWGGGQRFGIVDIGFGEIYWFACANAPRGGRDTDVRRELSERFAGWHDPIERIIRATPAASILRTDICDRPPLRSWHDGRVVLIGDAAHAMTPNLGQGAGQAIEDAVVLDECLAQEREIETALRKFEQRRLARANTIARMSRRMGVVAQLRNPAAVWLRNLGMRFMPARVKDAEALKLLRQIA